MTVTVAWTDIRDDFNLWEGRVPYMYLDSRGFVTVAVGYMLPHSGAAAELAFVRRADGQPATADQIRAEFATVARQPPNRIASAYRGVTTMELPDAAIDTLLQATVARFQKGLVDNFAGFANYPAPAQRALLDMAYNLGIDGLLKFRKLKAAVEAKQWRSAAAESHRNGPSQDRNDWTRDMFLKAAG
jgi:GH24 family phage-related lysozyme (muramidase)